MIQFTAISYYASRVAALTDVKRGVYATVEDEVRAAFKGVTIEQIRQNYDMIRQSFGLRNTPEDQSQRMLNAIEPGSVLPIHRHQKTWLWSRVP